jgi:hypothetical protein
MAADRADPGQVPPPADKRPSQPEHQDRGPGRVQVYPAGDNPGSKHASANHHSDEGLCQLALVVHPRIAGTYETPESRVLSVKRLLDLLQLALLVIRERHDASQKTFAPGTCVVAFTSYPVQLPEYE